MIARVRRAVLISLLCLTSFATPASAGCAWVEWMESPVGSNQWTLSTGREFIYDKREDCERAARASLDAKISRRETQEKQCEAHGDSGGTQDHAGNVRADVCPAAA